MPLYFIPKYQVPDGKFPVLSKDDILHNDDLSELSGQLKQLSDLLQLPPEELDERRASCEKILQILRKFYPESSLFMFGSSVNSFGIKGCDLDLLFLPFPTYCNLDNATNETKKEKTPLPDPASILTGEVSNNVLAQLDEYTHLKFIRTALRHEKIFKRANFIPAPKCPILKGTMYNSNLFCEISASNRLVVFNSELLQFFDKLDKRVKPLVICLRYWARSLGFIKRSFFSSYSFTLLVIFFLQSIPSPILPSVQHLIEISGISRMEAGWETAFCTDVQRFPKFKNTQTIGELFIQFFEFYFRFDFLQCVVSPHCGKPLLIEDIKNSKDERMTNFEISPLNIQDVFILSRNVCKVEKVSVFKLALLTAHEMLKGEQKINLPTLFDPNAYQRILDYHYYKCMSGQPLVCFISLDYECRKKFDCLETWYEKASEALYEVLQYGMLMECEVTDKIYSRKKEDITTSHTVNNNTKDSFTHSSMKNSTSTPYDIQLLISIQCVLYSRTWIGRKKVEVPSLDSEDDAEVFAGSVLGKEHCISKSMVNKNPLLSSPVPVLCFICDCYKHVSPELNDVIVILKPLTTSREFYQISAFLSSFLPKTVKKILTSN